MSVCLRHLEFLVSFNYIHIIHIEVPLENTKDLLVIKLIFCDNIVQKYSTVQFLGVELDNFLFWILHYKGTFF